MAVDVSIVVAIYNAEEYIGNCLDMLTRQTLKNIEIICVDDGSVDGSLEMLQAYSSRDERIGYVAVNPKCKDAELIINMCGQVSRFTGHNCPSSLIQLGVAKVLDETSDLSIYEKNKNILYKELTAMGYECVEPGGTFYMFPKTPIADANEFCNMTAHELDLILVPGDSFMCPGHMRLAYCTTTDMVERSLPLFEKAIKMCK